MFSMSNTQIIISDMVKAKKSVRKIFSDVKMNEEEQKKLKEFEELIVKEKVELPSDWNPVDTFRFMYSGKLDLKKSLKIMKQHLQWRELPERGVIDPPAKKFIDEGIIYISGRDKQYRPIIIINLYRVDLKIMSLKDIIEALCFVLDVCRKYYFVPGKVENWVIFLELNHGGIFDFPTKVLKSINEITSVNYTSTLDRFFIMNPSSVLKKTWSLVSSFIDPETAGKISMVTKSEYPQLLERISKDQLLQKYGGTLPEKYCWPPENTLNLPPYTKESNQEIQEINLGIPINQLDVQESRDNQNDKNERSKISTEDASRMNRALENSNINFAKSVEVQNLAENEGICGNDKFEQQIHSETLEKNISDSNNANINNKQNEERNLRNLPPQKDNEMNKSNLIQKEKVFEIPSQEVSKNQTNLINQNDVETFIGNASFGEDRKTRNVNAKAEDKENEVKVLNEGTIALYSQEDEDDKGKRSKKDTEVTFGGVKVNEISGDFTGKHSRIGDQDRGISLERDKVSIGFCGFCKSTRNSEENQTQNCNIF